MADLPRRPAALGGLLTFAVLLWAAPSPASSVRELREAATATDPTAPLVAAVALLAWLLAGWLLLTVLLTVASQAPGFVGPASAAVVRRVAPAALRKLVGAALGITIVAGLTATPAGAAPGGGTPVAAPVTSAVATSAPASLDWPGASAPPDLDWPADAPASAPDPRVLATPVAGQQTEAVVVQPGDTLWGLAERSLATSQASPTDRQVAATWPAWWEANREVLGDDPDLLRPGTPLQPPDDGVAPDRS